MSFSTWHDYGYGIKTDDIKTDAERIKKLIGMAPDFERWVNDKFSEAEIADPDFNDYMELEDGEIPAKGIAYIISEVIAESEDLKLSAVSDFEDNAYLVFSAGYPWRYTEKERLLSESDIEQALQKYVSVLTDEPLEIEYQEIENFG